MIKFLFFDNRDYELVQGFQRRLGQACKHEGNPLEKRHAWLDIAQHGAPFLRWHGWDTLACSLPFDTAPGTALE